MIQGMKFELNGVVDRIDNMEEQGKTSKIDVYKDMRADKKVRELKADATVGIGEEQKQPPIESQVYLTSEEKCMAIPVCIKCADARSCLTAANVDQACYFFCLSNPAQASPTTTIVFLGKHK